MAAAVAAAATPSFLVARITSSTLAAADSVADAADPGWLTGLPRFPDDAIRQDLDSRLGSDAQRARDLLRPLAHAQGQGLPWENIWAPLASQISGRRYTDSDLFWLRENAGSYIVEAIEDNRSVYRLYHQALAEHLCADATEVSETAVHRAFVDVLMRIPRRGDATRDWERAHPYALRHLASHAAAAGALDGLLGDSGYLVHAVPETLLTVLDEPRTEEGNLRAKIYRASADVHRSVTPQVRRQLLAVDAVRYQAVEISDSLRQDGTWHPRWATGSLVNQALRASMRHHVPVTCGACIEVDGTPVLVAGGGDDAGMYGELLVWDLRTSQLRAELDHHSLAVQAIASIYVDGVPVAVSVAGCPYATSEGEIRVWDLRTGQRLACFQGQVGGTYSVTCENVNGSPVAFTYGRADETGTSEERSYDLRTLRPYRPRRSVSPSKTQEGPRVDGTQLSLRPSGKEITVTDTATGAVKLTLTGHSLMVSCVAHSEIDGSPIAVSVAGQKFRGAVGEVRVWDLRTGQERATLTGHRAPVNFVTCTHVDDVPVAVTGAGCDYMDESEVRIWDLRAASMKVNDNFGHHVPVTAAACYDDNGETVLLTGGGDKDGNGELGVWIGHEGLIRGSTSPNRYPVKALALARVNEKLAVIAGGGLTGRGNELSLGYFDEEANSDPTGWP